MHQRLPAWWATPLIGAFGGWLASLANWPLPWMVGSLLAVIAVRCSGWLVSEMPRGRQVGQWIVASAIGLHFTGEVMREVLAHFGVILAGAVGTLLLGLIGIFILLRSGSDRATAFFASMPGGASEMVVLANRHQAEAASVAAAHSLRLLLVVLIVPALFTWGLPTVAAPPAAPVSWPWLAVLLPAGGLLALLWKRLGQPNPWMLGPLTACALASVAFDLHIGLPGWAGALGQWLIGCSLACHFDRPFFRSAPAFLLRILLFTLLAMLVAAALGGALGWLTALDEVSLMLGMMPGGITELCLTAEALQLSVALVTAVQVLRLFLVMFLAEPLFRLWQRRAG
ncbi:AbrB family transcriptional regulator [Stutzerimonas stutzeri]|uniref:AbrB family transcriptional regulator n=1 Tax=Stutzerimonas stutzeri TaxID=316 RepID=UPI00020474D3|nr:AbrB family transcriptional regulator [Stutzerimonas stutzeri]AEA86043.1 putative ammonia monooxygenase [Stutzerimonas stutzeri DSM 4166]MDH0184816.1 AbrB family transcriptional regulator [Stutzerimonas stutzeri]MDH0497615.1 AbrB family transcriptional regulator [Stutzerimonas stutzeri]MDH1249033.1 AbrB family transcriptional regulator [Stutzerimonas stutzeri]MDH1543307.1 AbrB family transcriptional regulator [Stutzerimonas stutzeri]